ncbi:hypothetical protein AYO44_10655 [Planctomycetaceae bacterium SCGC AG-212-F19]|nr:hypothetical protein AYO44_10655 [Planctomycetaceae bacterium SCGC AG-212-F19]
MSGALDRYTLRFTRGEFRHQLFQPADPRVAAWFKELYRKYGAELAELAKQLQARFQAMVHGGFGAVFGDVEGELLYCLVREFRPEVVFEISPNAGYSTNYMLAALTRNGQGRIESFELIRHFFGRPTEQVIRGNLVDLCDASRFHLHIGDARITVPEQLRQGAPDFTLIDSCHDDFFAEFYVKELLPRCRGTAFIQDIAHFDMRPEHATEAYYLLSYFQETATPLLAVGSYEDELNAAGVRKTLMPRRAVRSNSVVVRLPDVPHRSDPPERVLAAIARTEPGPLREPEKSRWPLLYPLNSARIDRQSLTSIDLATLNRPEDRYVAAWYRGRAGSGSLTFCELLALREGRVAMTDELERRMVGDFTRYDSYAQLLVLESLLQSDKRESARQLLGQFAGSNVRGAEIPRRVAAVALALGQRQRACDWLERSQEATELSLAVGYRDLLACADLFLRAGDRNKARGAFHRALDHICRRRDAIQGKASGEVFRFCLKHPRFLPGAFGAGLHHNQWGSAFGAALRGLARRVLRPLGLGRPLLRRG